jgi:hypothetical protein
MQTWVARIALSAIELLIALGLGLAAFSGTFALGCRITKCVDASGMLWLVIGFPVAVIVGIAFWIAMWRTGTRYDRRLACDGVAMAIGLGAYLVPLYLSQLATARSVAEAANGNRLYMQRRPPDPTPSKFALRARSGLRRPVRRRADRIPCRRLSGRRLVVRLGLRNTRWARSGKVRAGRSPQGG